MTTLKIEGMSCNHGVMAVEKALKAVNGIKNVQVKLDPGEAIFDMEGSADLNAVKAEIEKAGYRIG